MSASLQAPIALLRPNGLSNNTVLIKASMPFLALQQGGDVLAVSFPMLVSFPRLLIWAAGRAWLQDDEAGSYAGFDQAAFTSHSGGKLAAVQHIKVATLFQGLNLHCTLCIVYMQQS